MDDAQNFIEVYRQEAEELLAEIEETVLELEDTPEDQEAVNRLFRAVHTIKGSGAMFGFDNIVDFTHNLETVLDRVRDGILPVTKELININLKCRDHIKNILDCTADGSEIDKEYEKEIIDALNNFLNIAQGNAEIQDKIDEARKVESMDSERDLTYRIRFKPNRNIFLTGTDPALLIEELKGFGEYEITPRLDKVPHVKELNPEECHIFWDIILTTRKKLNTIKDVFIFVEDECDINIDIIDEETDFEEEGKAKKLGEILVERKDVAPEQVEDVLKNQKRIGELLVDSNLIDPHAVESALSEQSRVNKLKQKRKEIKSASSLRVSADKLDTLVDLVGELVTVQASLSQKASAQDDPELLAISEEVERLTADLRDNTMGIRMLPIGTTFSKFKRLVRDLSDELGKEIHLITEGSETELDKTVIERLNDPLVHIIRNSIDHGIELPADREDAGKSRQGTVRLTAEHSGANVLIRITDDGKGLDPESILARAVEKGLVQPDAGLTESEIFSLILAPGFSTARKVTDISGRGVGMDVVKRAIESLRGILEISSEKGMGTTITLKLPLTLAIIDGLLMQIGDTHYVIPLSSVDECVELTREDVNDKHGRHIMKVREELVPYVPLREIFGINGEKPSIEQIVITDMEGFRVGFAVDQIIGEHQTVIKNLGEFYKEAQGFSGATILADGTVALILDVNGLSEIARMEEQRS